ncbi:iron uptake porin [Synechococcus sp. PCC 6717]|nr:iron uptake porin [Synechococcus sp. PCC 6717]
MARPLWACLGLAVVPVSWTLPALAANKLQYTLESVSPNSAEYFETNNQQVPEPVTVIAQNRRPAAPVPSVAELDSGAVLPTPSQPQDQSLGIRRNLPQVTSVNQLSDVRPTDWAYQALASLVEKYGCIAGYPDGTFRGNRAATRYELAAAVNACLDVISDRFATKEDLATLQKLMQEFANELALVKGRVTNLEGRVANLEATQFATMTVLRSSVLVNVSDVLSGTFAVPAPLSGPSINDNPVVTYRARFNFDTSFSGKDVLRVRLQAANMPAYQAVTGTNMARLAYDTNTAGAFRVDDLYYRTPLGDRLFLAFDANAGNFDKNVFVFNPLLQSDETGSLTRFGRFNPIYRIAGGGAGLSLRYKILENKERGTGIDFNLSYQAPRANLPFDRSVNPPGPNNALGNDNGFFNGAYGALAQLDLRPAKNMAFGFTYVRSFGTNVAGGTGSSGFAGSAANPTGVNDRNTAADSFGFQFTYRPIQKFNVAGWVGYSDVRIVQNQADFVAGARNAEVLNWAVSAAVPDLLSKGDVLGIIFGQPPQTINVRNTFGGFAPSTAFNSYHIEGLYRYRVSPNIAITPGIIALVNPNSNSNNSPIILGVVRTTFTF